MASVLGTAGSKWQVVKGLITKPYTAVSDIHPTRYNINLDRGKSNYDCFSGTTERRCLDNIEEIVVRSLPDQNMINFFKNRVLLRPTC